MEETKFKSLKEQMIKAGISQKQLAKSIGICEKSMSYKMTGQREFTRTEILAICRCLKATLDELFGE